MTVTVCVDWRKIVKMASVCISTLVSKLLSIITNYCKINFLMFISLRKYVVKHKSAKLLMTFAVGKLEAALNISHLMLSTRTQRVSYIELVS